MTKNYTADLQEALRVLLMMASEREQLETKIAKQKKRVAALYELVQADEDSPAVTGLVEGITDACRVVLRAAEKPLSPAEIRDRVQALGLPPQANLLASIHTTLRRLKEASEISDEIDKSTPIHSTVYTWGGNIHALSRLGRLSALMGTTLDSEQLPEEIRASIYPRQRTPGELKKKLEDNLRRK